MSAVGKVVNQVTWNHFFVAGTRAPGDGSPRLPDPQLVDALQHRAADAADQCPAIAAYQRIRHRPRAHRAVELHRRRFRLAHLFRSRDGNDLDTLRLGVHRSRNRHSFGGELRRLSLVAQLINGMPVPERVFGAHLDAFGDALFVRPHMHALMICATHGIGDGPGKGLLAGSQRHQSARQQHPDSFHGSHLTVDSLN